ncbi:MULTISPECIES: GIY-YIG nuclease family protein [unclassified Bradyrhizobium]|uniref:GIY-YIG nuclease family protein n=1 Tax=unclassified Bradyrhizobium TaxID=2631580 RepID=UPI00339AB6A8
MYLLDGSTTGLIFAEIVNWTGMAVVVQRSNLAEFLNRPEAQKAGCYILAGQDPDDPFRPLVYVGESEVVGKRLREHDADEEKAFFQRAIVFISKDENLTKAHVRHLEKQLTERIKEAGRTTPMHSNEPGGASLPEADRSDMDYYLDQAGIVLPALGLDILRPIMTAYTRPTKNKIDVPTSGVERILFSFSVGDARATATENRGDFVVLKGSIARGSETPSYPKTYKALREKLRADGTLQRKPGADTYEFTRDTPFDSPTAAAAVIYGTSISGPANWKISGTEQTYGQFRERSLETATMFDSSTAVDTEESNKSGGGVSPAE